jgi:hypothetical protein
MRAVLDAVRRAGPKGNDRGVVARALTGPGPYPSVLGAATLSADGDPIPDHWSEAAAGAGAPVPGTPLG